MKILVTALLLIASAAQATPYLRPNAGFKDPAHPQLIAGALLDPLSLDKTSGGSMLPVFTHSPKDGCLLPSIVCESWTPFAVGGSMNAGKVTLDIGPIANVLPWAQAGALSIVPAKWDGLVKVLSPSPDQSVTFSAGPIWEYNQRANRGYFKVFTGLQLNF